MEFVNQTRLGTLNPQGQQKKFSPPDSRSDQKEQPLLNHEISSLNRSTQFTSSEDHDAGSKRRLSRVKEYCRNRKPGQQTKNLFVLEKYKIVYCPIHKAGSTTFTHILLMLIGKADPRRGFKGGVYHAGRDYIPKIKQFTPARREEILRDYFKVMIVRDPLERLLSAYKDKMLDISHRDVWIQRLLKDVYGKPIPKSRLPQVIRNSYRKPPPKKGESWSITFLQFLEYILLLKPNIKAFDSHWRPYNVLCTPCDVNYDFIGETNTLSKDIPYILEKIKVTRLPKSIPGRYAGNRTTHYFSDIPRDIINDLWNLYKEDYQMFGYNFTVPNL